jgi:hypothetical protein
MNWPIQTASEPAKHRNRNRCRRCGQRWRRATGATEGNDDRQRLERDRGRACRGWGILDAQRQRTKREKAVIAAHEAIERACGLLIGLNGFIPIPLDLGLQLLALGEGSTDIINAAIERISQEAAQDGANHDFTASFGPRSSGLTIHCSYRPAATAAKALAVHCNLRKYAVKASHWFGLAIDPGTAALRFGVKLEGDWQHDPQMEDAVKKCPREFARTK